MPTGAPPASSAMIVRTLASAIFCAASRSVASARAGDRRIAHELAQRAGERLLLGDALAVLAVEALQRLLQRLGDRLRAVALELGRHLAQLQEIRARQQVAAGVLDRVEDPGRRAAGRQRAHRKQLARAERAVGIGLRVVGPAADEPALDDVEMRHRRRTASRVSSRPWRNATSASRGTRNASAASLIRLKGACRRRNSFVASALGVFVGIARWGRVVALRLGAQSRRAQAKTPACGGGPCGSPAANGVSARRPSPAGCRCSGARRARPTCPRRACRDRAASRGSRRGSRAGSR